MRGITLHVEDLERSLAFYREVPGVELYVHEEGESALLRVGSGWLGLMEMEEGGFHLQFECEDLDGLYEQSMGGGAVPVPRELPWGEHAGLTQDPDGNVIEFGRAGPM